MKKNFYIPERGDIVYLDFDPAKGHEQKGLRPAFIISPRVYNEKTFLALFMPITKHQKGYPFEVLLPPELKMTRNQVSAQDNSYTPMNDLSAKKPGF